MPFKECDCLICPACLAKAAEDDEEELMKDVAARIERKEEREALNGE